MTTTPSLSPADAASPPAPVPVVLPVRHAEAVMPAGVAYVREARRFAERLLAHWAVAETDRDSAVLVVGELAANAAVHGRHTMSVGLVLDGRTLRIEVTDRGDPVNPAPGRDDGRAGSRADDRADDECGRGLVIVACLAASVQVREAPWGRAVRATMSLATASVSVAVPAPASELDLLLAADLSGASR